MVIYNYGYVYDAYMCIYCIGQKVPSSFFFHYILLKNPNEFIG